MISLVPVDTGELRDSIDYNVEADGSLNFEATAEYAGYVEFGTSKMSAQPFFMPPLDTLQASGIGDEFGRDALSRWEQLVSEYQDE
jgi:HK97 gp10 family phage protein